MAVATLPRTAMHACRGSMRPARRPTPGVKPRAAMNVHAHAMITPYRAQTSRVTTAAGSHTSARLAAPARMMGRVRRAPLTVEANLFSRIARVIRSYVSSFTAQIEDPELLLDRCVDEMNEDLIKMRQATARVMASERQMASKQAASQATADEWLRRAELAVRSGQDALAREALLRRKTHESAAAAMGTQLEAQRRALEQLQANMRLLEGKLAEARNKRETLKARAASAKSSKQIQEMVAGLRLNNSTAWAAFDRMEEKVVALEAESESAALLATPDNIEQRFAQLERTGGVDDELEVLKRGLQSRTPVAAGALNAGRPVSEVLGREPTRRMAVVPLDGIDAELEQLRKRVRE